MAYLLVYKNGKKTHDGLFDGDETCKLCDLLKGHGLMKGNDLDMNKIVYAYCGYKLGPRSVKYDTKEGSAWLWEKCTTPGTVTGWKLFKDKMNAIAALELQNSVNLTQD